MSHEPSAINRSPLLELPNTYRAFYGAFPHLHPVQRQAIEPIIEGKDLILQSATGSGKTEAVLAPCLERVIRSGQAEAVLYIVPTRALAIDLERRLEPVTQRLELGLGVRTGDVKRSSNGRTALTLTTPESLDVMLGSKNAELRFFLQRVRMVVVDEVHPLVYQYRGRQLAYLLERLERRSNTPLQKIALSATIADADAVIEFFGFRPDAVRLISAVQREIVPHLVHLKKEEQELTSLLDDLYDVWGYRKVLMFANSRGRCDRLFAQLSRQGRYRNVCEIHYSNLKPKERRGVESRFRRRSHALCIATSTLELGIDIGDVDGVILFEPPESVSAFLQRIGRSNRRERSTHFWGICRGEHASEQLLRFLGLLRLANVGLVETPLPKKLPSVLVQQILSCLYEKKLISLPAMQELFPDRKDSLALLFPSLEQQAWLRSAKFQVRSSHFKLFHGGWRYGNSLLERKIWSNFPETEEYYALELSGETIADLPSPIVRQLEPGDRVQLAGRRIRILQIDSGERKRVLAEPADRLDEKELFWLGAGLQVSYEVAQAIRAVLKAGVGEEVAVQGLFARTRKLLQAEMEKSGRSVVLANGIEVLRTPGGLYRYLTFLGSIGNLILQHTIGNQLAAQFEGLYTASDEIGIDCSHRIDFKELRLPVDRDAFHNWVKRNIRLVRSVFSLNAFCDALPRHLLVEELTGFLYDGRVAEKFLHYMRESSEVVSGDPSLLELPLPDSGAERDTPLFLHTPAPVEPLLEWEKKRWLAAQALEVRRTSASPGRAGTVTGTIIGEYIRHRQCERRISLGLLPPEEQPPRRIRVDTELDAVRTELGRKFEQGVLERIKARNGTVIIVEATDTNGNPRSIKERFEESMERLEKLIRRVQAETAAPEQLYLAQAVLVVRSLINTIPHSEFLIPHSSGLDGVGIPDLIKISFGPGGPILEVGDIKDSSTPHYSQKWQVAFYAALLKELMRSETILIEAQVSDSGFLITRPLYGASKPELHTFDLKPYLAAFPSIIRNIAETAARHPSKTSCRLKEHCTTCPYFEFCYKEALGEEDIQFLPELSQGALWKMRQLGLKTLDAAARWFNAVDVGDSKPATPDPRPGWCTLFSPRQRELLEGRIQAMTTNRIGLRRRKTRLFPANISTAIFLHILEDPVSGLANALGWRAVDGRGTVVETRTWTMVTEDDLESVWKAFSERFLKVWQGSIENARGPHIFHFGKNSRETLFEWSRAMGDANKLSFLWGTGRFHWTDLRRLLLAHFDFPAPGTLTLFSLARILNLKAGLKEPESLFHRDDTASVSPVEGKQEESLRKDAAVRIDTNLELEEAIWRWAASHLESELYADREEWEIDSESQSSPAMPYLRFLEEERRLREEDILTMQEHTLDERVERFRAVGPLSFIETTLDEEGRFIYRFQILEHEKAGLSKFREGDFLKLAPTGTRDLQSGFPVILSDYSPREGQVSVLSRQYRLAPSKRLTYSLEEDLTDWNSPKLEHVVRTVFSESLLRFGMDTPPLLRLFTGGWPLVRNVDHLEWVKSWLSPGGGGFASISGLNQAQQQALELPFRYRLSLIEGPPGTGKTHLLGWILIALMRHAFDMGRPLRIAVSALTHQAIDNVLIKVVELVNRHRLGDTPARFAKLGRWKENGPAARTGDVHVETLTSADEINRSSHIILGATGFGLYNLLEGRKGSFPPVFDWVIFDEASQVLIPQAILSLVYGKGNFLFLGDVKQLPPVVLGTYEDELPKAPGPEASPPLESPACGVSSKEIRRSILAHLIQCYSPGIRVRLDQTYRMNEELCTFPSRMWYDGALRPAKNIAGSRLAIKPAAWAGGDMLDRVLDPEKPAVLLLVDHHGCHQKSDIEVEIVSQLARRLMAEHHLTEDRLALISPHRAQNNAIADRLAELLKDYDKTLPLIDTVERVQGAERDAVIFSLSTSDPDHTMSDFLNNPNRFNVAITRARQKLIVIGSSAFFRMVPHSEDALQANRCFKEFHEFCLRRNSLFVWPDI